MTLLLGFCFLESYPQCIHNRSHIWVGSNRFMPINCLCLSKVNTIRVILWLSLRLKIPIKEAWRKGMLIQWSKEQWGMFQNGIQDAKSQDTPLGTAPPSRNTFMLRNVKHFTELSQICPSSGFLQWPQTPVPGKLSSPLCQCGATPSRVSSSLLEISHLSSWLAVPACYWVSLGAFQVLLKPKFAEALLKSLMRTYHFFNLNWLAKE